MRAIFGIILTVLLVMAAEVTFHWYAGTAGTPLANRLAHAYLYRDPNNHKAYVAGLVDLVAPAIVLGVALGFFGAAWPPRYLAVVAVVLALSLVALFPLYSRLFQNGGEYLWSPVNGTPATNGDYVVTFMKALALCGVFTYGARLLTQHFQHPSGPLSPNISG